MNFRFRNSDNSHRKLYLALGGFAGIVAVAICVLVWSQIETNKSLSGIRKILPTDEAPIELMGWAGKAEFDANVAAMEAATPQFQIIGADKDHAKSVVKLWEASITVNGEILPTFRQLVGDCVGAGALQAIMALHCQQAAVNGDTTCKPIFEPFHYAMGRNAPYAGAGKLNRGREPWSGSIGGWQAIACQKGGVLPQGAVADDGETLPEYSLAVIKNWAVRMPDEKWQKIARQYPIKTVARVKTGAAIRDAVCSGYPCTIASDWGGMMNPPLDAASGHLVNRKVTTWQHQMAVIGYDGESPGGPYWFVINSWGPSAHGTPTDGSPPGGFWIRQKDMDYIAKADCWAFSDADGFPARDWVIIEGAGRWSAKPWDAEKAAILQGPDVRVALCFALSLAI